MPVETRPQHARESAALMRGIGVMDRTRKKFMVWIESWKVPSSTSNFPEIGTP